MNAEERGGVGPTIQREVLLSLRHQRAIFQSASPPLHHN